MIGLVIIALALAFLSVVLFWLVYPYDVSKVEEPITVLNKNKEISIGSNIELELKVYKPNNIKPDTLIFISCDDGNLLPLTPLPVNLPIGKYTVISDSYILPPKVAIGAKCKFNFRNTYQVNPIRSIIREWSSEEFLVLGKDFGENHG